MYQCFRPGKVWYDTEGKRIQAHGGSLLYADGKFWWYGENKEGVTGRATGEVCPAWHHGVRLYSSGDLYNWKDEGVCVPESDDPENPFYPAHIMDRPHILYHKESKNYVLWAKTARNDFGKAGFSVCVGKDLHALKFVKEISPAPYHAGDFDLFEWDGRAYIVYENPHNALISQPLTDDYCDLVPEPVEHLHAECPPFVREAPAFFTRNGRKFLLTSGTTGYFPNPSEIAEMEEIQGNWKTLGNACENDVRNNSFHAQFSSVFRHPFKRDLYIALGDRWLTDLTEDLPDMCEAFYGLFNPNAKQTLTNADLPTLSDDNTSEADYVWLPVRFREDGTPYIAYVREWRTEDFD